MEILNSINDLEVRSKVVQALEQAVQIRWGIEQGKADIKEIADFLKEENGIKPAEFKKVVETIFKNDLAEKERTLDGLKAVVDLLSSSDAEND